MSKFIRDTIYSKNGKHLDKTIYQPQTDKTVFARNIQVNSQCYTLYIRMTENISES